MRTWQCKCGWIIGDLEYLRINYDAQCSRCGRRYSTFTRGPEIHIRSVPAKRQRKKKF